MLTTGAGRIAVCAYLLTVLSAVATWLAAGLLSGPDNVFLAGFYSVLILTLPIGLLGYGVLSVFAMGLGSDGVVPIVVSVLSLVVFMGAAVVNVIAVQGLWRWCKGRRPPRHPRAGLP